MIGYRKSILIWILNNYKQVLQMKAGSNWCLKKLHALEYSLQQASEFWPVLYLNHFNSLDYKNKCTLRQSMCWFLGENEGTDICHGTRCPANGVPRSCSRSSDQHPGLAHGSFHVTVTFNVVNNSLKFNIERICHSQFIKCRFSALFLKLYFHLTCNTIGK